MPSIESLAYALVYSARNTDNRVMPHGISPRTEVRALEGMVHLFRHAHVSNIQIDRLMLMQDNCYIKNGAAWWGDMTGGALPAHHLLNAETNALNTENDEAKVTPFDTHLYVEMEAAV